MENHTHTKTKIERCCEIKAGVHKDAVMIVGVANAGLVGTIGAAHIIEKMNLKEIAHIHSSLFPPVSVFMDGILKHPFRIYADADDTPCKTIIATSELPLNKETFHEVAHVLVDFAEEIKVRNIVALVGFPVQELVEETDVYFAAEPEIFERLKKIETLKPLPKGMIYGLEALVLNETLERHLDGFCLITPVRDGLPSTRSAAALIEAVNSIFDFINVNVEELLERDKFLQDKLRELAEQIRRSQEPEQYMQPPAPRNVSNLFT